MPPRAIRGGPRNLLVRELDAAAALAARRTQLEAALNEIARPPARPRSRRTSPQTVACRCTSGVGIGRELMDLAPPGIDELFGIISVVDARADYDVIVVDTAPTGHALRLLEMPDAAREWVQVLLRVLLKYRSLVRPGQLAAELVDVSKSIRELQELLRDADADAVHRRHARGGGAAARDRAAADAAAPSAAVDAGGRRERDDAVARALPALPRDRRGRTARARRLRRPARRALSSRPRSPRRRREASRRSSAGRACGTRERLRAKG